MISLGGHFLDVMVIIMLAVVGALVLWLHFRLYRLKSTEKEVPSLVASLADSLQKAHRGVFELSRVVREEGPKLEKENFEAQQTVQDLDFMLGKAEKLLKRMDESFERAETLSLPITAAVKTQEKDMLIGAPAQETVAVKKSKPAVKKAAPAVKPKPQAKTDQKALEREFLTGKASTVKAAKAEMVEKETPKRMASPMTGAQAYGQQVGSATSDAERDLRQALEGRL